MTTVNERWLADGVDTNQLSHAKKSAESRVLYLTITE